MAWRRPISTASAISWESGWVTAPVRWMGLNGLSLSLNSTKSTMHEGFARANALWKVYLLLLRPSQVLSRVEMLVVGSGLLKYPIGRLIMGRKCKIAMGMGHVAMAEKEGKLWT